MDPAIASRYKDYDQCYAELGRSDERKREAWNAFGDGFKQQPKKSVTCHTSPDYGAGQETTCQ